MTRSDLPTDVGVGVDPDTRADSGSGDGGPDTASDRAATANLSTQPIAPEDAPAPRRRRLAPAIRAWRWLTSMRTALVLLFLLALAAVPGSLLPQRDLNAAKVDTYLAAHPTLGPLLSKLSLFDVFAAPWFAAIYLLLFISLVGCIIPRLRVHFRAMRTPPPAVPRHLGRLPESTSFHTETDTDSALADVRQQLRRWRVRERRTGDGTDAVVAVSAERGYLRETGNLLFHVALTGVLVAVGIGQLWGYSGTVVKQTGEGFCNTIQQYDSFRPGRLVTGASLAPFCMDLQTFSATYAPDGTADQFTAGITYSEGTDGTPKRTTLRVNHPLRIEGLRLYLLGHGFAPVFTVRDSDGQVFSHVSAPFIPQDAAFTSEGVLKLPDAGPKQIAIQGLFAPTVAGSGKLLTSVWPQASNPGVAIFVYEGNLGLDTGNPQSVYTLDQDQISNGALKRTGKANLSVGQTYRLRDGTTIRFDGVRQWASLQVSRDPTQQALLVLAVLLVIGLIGSLRVRRRRVWFRLTPTVGDAGGRRTLVEAGGLARTDPGAFHDEFTGLAERVRRGEHMAERVRRDGHIARAHRDVPPDPPKV